jgi:hypothetical protein
MMSTMKPDPLLFVELNGLVGKPPPDDPAVEITVGDLAPIEMRSIEFSRASSLPVFGIRATLIVKDLAGARLFESLLQDFVANGVVSPGSTR